MKIDSLYRKKACELCGKEVFEKYLGAVTVNDGGYTKVEKFEDSGFGSMILNFFEIDSVDSKRTELKLCPECAKRIEQAIRDTITNIKGAMS